MSGPKTADDEASVEEFLNGVENTKRREDSFQILEIMQDVNGKEPEMWGPSIVSSEAITTYTKAGGRGIGT